MMIVFATKINRFYKLEWLMGMANKEKRAFSTRPYTLNTTAPVTSSFEQ